MDASGLGGSQFLSSPVGGLLDLESSVPRQKQTHLGHLSSGHQLNMNFIGALVNDHCQPIGLMEVKDLVSKGYSINLNKRKADNHVDVSNDSNASNDDEPSFSEDGNGENSCRAKGKKESQWQRMKWTDDVVRLLIAVVACVGDDGAPDGVDGPKRKSGIMQKKGKWKTVSKMMINKGCHVSPQQCEDKFNDLNKRYKRLNDILGRGASCNVVENPALMDSIPHLSAKAKDDVRKILSSKHLFYKEMCAYHNGQRIPNCQDLDMQGCSLPSERCFRDNNATEAEGAGGHDYSDEDESDNEDDNSTDEDEGRTGKHIDRSGINEGNTHLWSQSVACNGFEVEMNGIFENPTVSSWEKKEWIKKQKLQLLEQSVSLQTRAFELQKQRFKWLRYCNKKDKEFQSLSLDNQRIKLQNEQSVLQLKQKKHEMHFRIPELSRDPCSLSFNKVQGTDQIDLDRHE